MLKRRSVALWKGGAEGVSSLLMKAGCVPFTSMIWWRTHSFAAGIHCPEASNAKLADSLRQSHAVTALSPLHGYMDTHSRQMGPTEATDDGRK